MLLAQVKSAGFGFLLPWSFRPMWGDEKPATPQWVVSAVRDVVEDFFGHLCGWEALQGYGEIN